MLATNLTPTQDKFVSEITAKVGKFLGTQLPGTFEMVSYPPGFHPAVQFSQPPVYNSTMLDAFNGMLQVGSNGMLTLGNSQFSTTYGKILAAASYQYSTADNKVIQSPNLVNQQIAVTNSADSSGFSKQFKLESPTTYYAVMKAVAENFSSNKDDISSGNIAAAAGGVTAAGFADLGTAITNGIQQLAPVNAIQNKQSQATRELATAQANSQNPTATNGGLDIGNGDFSVGWTPLPTNNQVQGGLQGGGSVSINITASNFSSTDSEVKIDGSTGFTVPIFDIVDVGFSASSSYDWKKHTSSSSQLDMTLEYEGVSLVQIDPLPLSADFKKGWYDETLLQSIVAGSGDDSVSGFKIPTSSQYNIATTFGPDKTFSRFRTLVVSKAPTITMVFSADQANAVMSSFKEKTETKIKLFGLFTVGSFDQSYSITKVDQDSASGTVTVKMGPPDITGTVPVEKQVCNILGGVAQYPPNN